VCLTPKGYSYHPEAYTRKGFWDAVDGQIIMPKSADTHETNKRHPRVPKRKALTE